MKKEQIIKLSSSIAITLSVGAIAGYCTATEIGEWYAGLSKPFFNPPNYVFGPVWTVLYILMGISLYKIWQTSSHKRKKISLILFFVQLFFNMMWSFIFFKGHFIGWALIDICIMWTLINVCIGFFYQVNKTAAWLMIPYMVWVSFAGVLNYAIWILNKGMHGY